jgi:hypothetical protein
MSSFGLIYKVCPIGPHTEQQVYYGSTIDDLKNRLRHHKDSYKSWKRGKANYVSIYNLFDQFGIANCAIHLVDYYQYNERNELRQQEQKFIQSSPCINQVFNNKRRKYAKAPVTFIQLYQASYFRKKQSTIQLFRQLPFHQN